MVTECNEAFTGYCLTQLIAQEFCFLLQVCMSLIFNYHCWTYDISLPKEIEMEKNRNIITVKLLFHILLLYMYV
jgi:hypothetical protein